VVQEVEYPKKVDADKILHLIVFGPPSCGKTHIANTIATTHKRALIKFD
jgi:hydrocephalus-inducing protein